MKKTAEQAFKERWPDAVCSVFKPRHMPEDWQVRERFGAFAPVAHGRTRAEAWKNACDRAGIDYRGRK